MPQLKSLKAFGWLLAASPYAIALLGQAKPTVSASYAKDVAPIFKAHCLSCHTGAQSAAGLDLSTPKGIKKGGLSGASFVAGKPEKSILLKRVLGHGGMPRMPMGFAPLSAADTAKIKTWIAKGGVFDATNQVHWAYRPIVRAPIPVVKNAAWVRNPIDAFILEKLQKEGMSPSKEASKETLIRRVTLDLTGLPPTLEEIDAFLADASPDAYEKVVDRLLQSPHYGERQTQIWLDLARYADTHGYEKDGARTAWKYRDWVIEAFNRNMPYDRFTIDQLAGDMLPKPTLEELVATGFNRNTMLNLEGGVDPEEGRYEMINDRVGTTSTVWLGQTLQCARCHDHKYDPLSQKDYFRMYAIFANTDYEKRGNESISEMKYFEPSIEAPTPQQAEERNKLARELAALQASYRESSPDLSRERSAWIEKLRNAPTWETPVAASVDGGGASLRQLDDGSYVAEGPSPNQVVYTLTLTPKTGTVTALRIEAIPQDGLANRGPGRAGSGNFILSRVDASLDGQPVAFQSGAADYTQSDFPLHGLFDQNGDTGWAVSPQYGKPHTLVVYLKQPLAVQGGQKLTVALRQESPTWVQHTLGRFRVSVTSGTSPLVLEATDEIRQLALKSSRTASEEAKLDEFFRQASETLRPVREKRDAVQADLTRIKSQIPMAMVMREKDAKAALTAPLRIRGEFLQKGDVVKAGIPTVLAGTAPPKAWNRLSLAKWIVDAKNPLTSRVQVNRMWEQYFGHGIVETSDNWGTQGSAPTHPKLLDWLASEFMRQKWDMKAIHRLIVTSATYRQSSNSTAKLLAKDPGNFLYARGPRFRMEAEMIRDNALSAAGVLSLEVGGPSVYPYQPAGIWNSPYSGERWMTSQGKDVNRRGLYTFWKRTAPYPSFLNFDAMSREVCTVRRIRTNTPLQALNLLNDQAYIEAAKALAARSESLGKDPQTRVTGAFRLCTGRTPKPAELERLTALQATLVAKYRANPSEAKKLAATPEEAAWVMVANVLLNLDETITKE